MSVQATVMLQFYVVEDWRQDGVLFWEWLLQTAQRLGLPGGTAVRTIAGFGRGHVLHESHFVELAGHDTVLVEFIVSSEEAERLCAEVALGDVIPFAVQLPVSLCDFSRNKMPCE